jgi:hypothetical protein
MLAYGAFDAIVFSGHIHEFESLAEIFVVLKVSFHVFNVFNCHVFALFARFLGI